MTLDSNNNNLMFEIFESLNRQDPDSVRQVLETLYNGVMKIERERHLGVAPHPPPDRGGGRGSLCRWAPRGDCGQVRCTP